MGRRFEPLWAIRCRRCEAACAYVSGLLHLHIDEIQRSNEPYKWENVPHDAHCPLHKHQLSVDARYSDERVHLCDTRIRNAMPIAR